MFFCRQVNLWFHPFVLCVAEPGSPRLQYTPFQGLLGRCIAAPLATLNQKTLLPEVNTGGEEPALKEPLDGRQDSLTILCGPE